MKNIKLGYPQDNWNHIFDLSIHQSILYPGTDFSSMERVAHIFLRQYVKIEKVSMSIQINELLILISILREDINPNKRNLALKYVKQNIDNIIKSVEARLSIPITDYDVSVKNRKKV